MSLRAFFYTITLAVGLLAGSNAVAGMSSAMVQHCTPGAPGKPPVCMVRNVAVDINQNKRLHM